MKAHIFFLLIVTVLSPGFIFSANHTDNADKPLNGTWDFQLKKVWEIDRANSNIFTQISSLVVTDDGKIMIRDRKYGKTFILSADGTYIKWFAPRGEGPGEVKTYFDGYSAGDSYIVADFERLHYFDHQGKFIRSIPNTFFARRPVFFTGPDRMVVSPVSIYGRRDTTGYIKHVNLATGKEKIISEFKIFGGGRSQQQGAPARLIIIVGLSPLMTVGPGNGKVYYGISSQYKINAADLDGKPLFSFSVDRKNKDISKEDKKKLFDRFKRMPDAVKKQYLKNFPDTPTYHFNIREIGKYIYVDVPDPLFSFPGHRKIKQVDIFSLDGTYRYKTSPQFEQGFKPLDMIIRDGYLYALLEDQEEEQTKLVKYKITMPGS